MKHIPEDDLILYFYGESRRAGHIDRHLGECTECSARYQDIAGALALVAAPDVPLRDERYGAEVWQRIRHELREQEPNGWSGWLAWQRPALAAAAVAAFLIVALVARGRVWTGTSPSPPRMTTLVSADASERIRLDAISDHLEQSERVLLDVANAEGPKIDVSAQQAWASSLIDANRLYRDAAARAGEDDVAGLLDELERGLLDIVHGPSTLTPAELDRALVRLDATTLLFKIRVLSDELRERELAPAQPRTTL